MLPLLIGKSLSGKQNYKQSCVQEKMKATSFNLQQIILPDLSLILCYQTADFERLYSVKSLKQKVDQSFVFSHINRREEKSENAERQAICHHYGKRAAICR